MKKVYSLIVAAIISASMYAQVNVTYQVDITDYLMTNTLGENGIRIGGNFADYGATTSGNAMVNWSPSDVNSAMTEGADDVWSITVTYPSEFIGSTQQYKFVNNDWGTNEGTDAANTIGADGCGSDDGAGNVNRLLVIPDADVTYQYCWDHCFRCDGSDPLVTDIITVAPSKLNLNVSPNPAINFVAFTYSVTGAENVTLDVFSLMGEHVANVVNELQNSGTQSATYDMQNLATGTYIYRLQVGNYITSGTIVKN